MKQILYADDTLLFATSEMALQAMVTIMARICATFGQYVSDEKSEVMVVAPWTA